MQQPSRSSSSPTRVAPWLALAVLAAMTAGCKTEDKPGIFVELRLNLAADGDMYRPDHLQFYWMAAREEPLSRRLPGGSGSVDQREELLYRIFVELPGPLTEPRVMAAVGVRNGRVVSGGVLVLQPTAEAIRYERVELRAPLPDDNRNGTPDIIDADCLNVRIDSCYPPGVQPPGPLDGGTADEGPMADADVGDGVSPPDAPGTVDAGSDRSPDGGSAALLTDLIGHWKLDDATGTNVADATGRNNGTLRATNPLWFPVGSPMARWGGAVDLSMAANTGITVGRSESIDAVSRAFTISAWTWRPSNRAGFATVFSRRYMNTPNEHYNLYFSTGVLRALINSHATQGTVTATATSPINTWVHVGLTYDGMFLRLYQNGEQVAMAGYTSSIAGAVTPLCLGCGQNGSGETNTEESLGGRLDDVLFWNRSLNAVEMRRIFQGEHLGGM